jgi:PAS domain S-box-containing protein
VVRPDRQISLDPASRHLGEPLRATGGHHFETRNRVPLLGARAFLNVALGVAAVSVAYFLAARVSLALLTPSNGVAVFWPAAGVASGLVIALGSASRLPVALGVMLATIVANLMGDRNLPASIVFAVCNAAEALLIGWLVKSYLSENLALDSLRNVLGLLAATAIGTAVSAIGGTAGYILFHNLGASASGIWFDWFASDAFGVVTVAPVIIGLVTTAQSLPEKRELLNGLVGLVAIALVSTLGFSSSTEHWFTILPVSLGLPIAFWVAARCPPVFAAFAAFIVAFVVVWTITFGIGRLGDAAVPLTDRVLAAQVALVAMSSALLVLAALFQERRHGEAALKESKDRLQESNDRLQLALSAAKLGVFSIDLSTGRLAAIYGLPEGTTELSREESRARVHADDLEQLEEEFQRALGEQRREFVSEFRITRADNNEVRWIEARSTVSYDPAGRPLSLAGVSIDVTERKRSDDHQVLLISELDHRVKNVLACVTAIAQHASESSRSREDFLEALNGRIRSLANTHILLSQSRWHGVDLAELVRTELAPCGNRSTLIEGPSITVVAEAAQTVAMVLHELATNAAKYGALSNSSGQVSVVWCWRSNGSECRGLALEWRETGGPPVGTPHSSGHGTSVIRDLIPYELGGTVDYVLAPDGVRCKLKIPAPWLSIDK